MELIISCDDGRKQMLDVARILDKYGITGTFYIAPFEVKNDLTSNDIIELSENHIIGGHTLTHQRLTEVGIVQARKEIVRGKKELEDIIGKKITTFATPRGWYNQLIINEIEKAGFTEHRTTKMGITNLTGYDRMHLPCSAHMYPRPEYRGIGIKNYVLYIFDKAKLEDGYFNLLTHTKELTKYNLWEDFEEIIKYISNERRNDNRIENLRVMSPGEHAKLHNTKK